MWERLIRTVRKVLAGVIPQNARLTDECIHTIFTEVESLVNSRPLTKVSDDVSDAAPLTPNHFLLLNRVPNLAPGIFNAADQFKGRWRCVQHIANEFWSQWIKEYLPELNKRRKWLSPHPSLNVGDLVLVCMENTPRGVWPLGLVTSTKMSADGLVRSVSLRLKNNNVLERPVHKCILLETMS